MTVDERFDRIDRYFESLTRDVARIGQAVETLTQRLDGMDQRLDQMDERFDRIDQSIQNLNRYMLDFRTEVINRFQTLETRMDLFASVAASVDTKIPLLNKFVMELGSLTTQLVAEKWKQTDSIFALEGRLASLEQIVSKLRPAA